MPPRRDLLADIMPVEKPEKKGGLEKKSSASAPKRASGGPSRPSAASRRRRGSSEMLSDDEEGTDDSDAQRRTRRRTAPPPFVALPEAKRPRRPPPPEPMETEGRAIRDSVDIKLDTTPVDPAINFSTVGGLQQQLTTVLELMVLPAVYPALFQNSEAHGVLFTGPPGCGKTLVAQALASELQSRIGRKVSLYVRKGADILAKYVGQSEANLRQLFSQAQDSQPSIIFFDEIDGLAPTRNSEHDHVHASVVATLLAFLDGLEGRGQVFIIGATNRPDALDPALRRPGRFDKEIHFSLPDAAARAHMLELHTRSWPESTRPNEAERKRLGAATEGFSGADMKLFAREARVQAVRRSFPEIYARVQRLDVNGGKLQVGPADWDSALRSTKPSLTRPVGLLASRLPAPRKHLSTLVKLGTDSALQTVRSLIPTAFPPEKKVFYSAPFERPPVTGRLLLEAEDQESVDEVASRVFAHVPVASQVVLGPRNMLVDAHAAITAASEALEGSGRHCIVWVHCPERWYTLLDERERSRLRLSLCRADNPGALIVGVVCSSELEPLPRDLMDRIFPPSTVKKVLVLPPTFTERQAFFDQMRHMCSLPPPICVTEQDLREGIPLASDSVVVAPPESSLEVRRERLRKERVDGNHARVHLRYDLRQLLERLVESRRNPPSHFFGSVETLAKRLNEEPKTVRDKLRKFGTDKNLLFFSDIRESDENFATVQNFADAVTAVREALTGYLRQHSSAPGDLLGKLGLCYDFSTRELHQLSPEHVCRSLELWKRQTGGDESWLASLEAGACPGCGLADFEGVDTLHCNRKGCQHPTWHRECLMSNPPAKPHQWACCLCTSDAHKEKPVNNKGRSGKGAKKDEGKPAEPMEHKERPVTGIEPLKDLTGQAVKLSEGMPVGELDKLWGSVSDHVHQHQLNTDKSALVSAIRPLLKQPRKAIESMFK
eukprot:Hpha_TRINITY_DN16001_c3_g4::TRINITY_DN16001_c3_g4_i1::g.121409::m.121409